MKQGPTIPRPEFAVAPGEDKFRLIRRRLYEFALAHLSYYSPWYVRHDQADRVHFEGLDAEATKRLAAYFEFILYDVLSYDELASLIHMAEAGVKLGDITDEDLAEAYKRAQLISEAWRDDPVGDLARDYIDAGEYPDRDRVPDAVADAIDEFEEDLDPIGPKFGKAAS